MRSARRLAKRVPVGSRDFKSKIFEKGTGQWVELRDKRGCVVYRRLLINIIAREVEVRAKDPKHPLRRLESLHFLTI